jgi:hypothetical protein
VPGIRAHLPHRRLAALLALAALGLLAAGCGGGGDSTEGVGADGAMSKDEVVAKVESACTKASAYAVWLPEHLQKTKKTVEEGTTIMRAADDEFRASLEELDPPADLRKPIEALATDESERSATSLPEIRAALKTRITLYEEVGATRCAKSIRASLLSIGGKSVEEAYESVGLPLPSRPPGW